MTEALDADELDEDELDEDELDASREIDAEEAADEMSLLPEAAFAMKIPPDSRCWSGGK
jgi:hypothetical protein